MKEFRGLVGKKH